MINIKMQCCGLVLLGVILFIYSRQKKINLNTEKAFFRLLVTDIISLVMDILSLVVLRFQDVLPVLLVDFVCKAYVSTLVLGILFALLYVCIDIYNQSPMYLKRRRIYTGIALWGILLIFVLPIYKETSDVNNTYTYGPSTIAAYVFCLGFLAIIIVLMIRERKRMNPKRREAVLTWIGLMIAAAVLQLFYKQLLVVGFATAIGVTIIYLLLENPETNRDRDTGLFNETALMQYVKQLYSKNEDFGLLALVFPQTQDMFTVGDEDRQFEIDVIDYVCCLPQVYAFQCAENEILLVLKEGVEIDAVEAMLRSRFTFGWGKKHGVLVKPVYVLMPNAGILSRPEDILPFLQFAKQNSNEFADDRLVLDETMANQMYEERRIAQLINDAIKYDRIEVYYQPIYSTTEKKFTSAEALCRIYTEEGEMISPGKFIEIAEQNGIILRLGERIFEKVCLFLQSGKPLEAGIHYIEVNLSVVQCSYEQLAERFIHIMEQHQINPAWINLEITETGSVSARKVMLENMNQLIDYGVHFSLDDFGTGQSNLNYIVDMPVNIVKFDRSMTVSYFNNGKAKYVMDAAMHMIHGMELQIVSEGIETEEQLNAMEDLNINYIQGFYFSKPLPEQDFLEFIREENLSGTEATS